MKAASWNKILRSALAATRAGRATWKVRHNAYVLSGRQGSLVIRPSTTSLTGPFTGNVVEFLDPEGVELAKIQTGLPVISGLSQVIPGEPTPSDIATFRQIVEAILAELAERDSQAERTAEQFARELENGAG